MGLFSCLGGTAVGSVKAVVDVCAFTGETVSAFTGMIFHPRRFRFGDFLLAFQRAAFDGFLISTGIGLLLGLILAFQSAAALKMFGAEVYVSDLLSIALFRELGPLITAIVLAGRSGSAFAAEIGTMKVDEELDALTTMGLSPVRFLVPPRVLAAVLAMPVLTVFSEIAGLAGGAGVLMLMGVPVEVFISHVTGSTSLFAVVFGLGKAALFGLAIGMIGCYCGMRAKTSADAVGVATTSSVVNAMVAIALIDGFMAVLCYICGV